MIKLNLNKSSAASSGRLCVLKRAAALITAATLTLALLFTGCPNSAGGSGGGTTPLTGTTAPTDKTYTVGGVQFTMKGIATVTNGTVGHTDNASNNAPHTVSLTAYRIGETEVTQELWQAVMVTNPSFFDNTGNKTLGSNTYDTNITSGETQGKRPVENVNWYQCIAFCNELTKKVPQLGESQCVYTYNGNTYNSTDAEAQRVPAINMSKKGFRLPTEAEWEWAAMGGRNDKWAGTNEKAQLVNYAWYDANSGNKTHQVKLKSANGYGLYDMSGNVWEWCWDRYSSTTPTGGQDPAGAASGDYRVPRGGSWFNDAGSTARAVRSNRDNRLGLRLVSRP